MKTSKIIEKLLSGEVICPVSSPAASDVLQDTNVQVKVRHALSYTGRKLARTVDNLGFYAVYEDLDDRERRSDIQRQFNAVASQWEGLCHWLRLTRKVSHHNYPMQAGDKIRLGTLLERVTDTSATEADVERIARRLKVKHRPDIKGKLEAIIAKLVKEGYLVVEGMSGTEWKATSKWSVLMEQLTVIHKQEGILLEEKSEQDRLDDNQGGLFDV